MFDLTASSTRQPLSQSDEYAAALGLIGRAPIRLDDGTLMLHRRFPGGLRMLMLPRARSRTLPALRSQLRDAGLHRCPVLLSPDRPEPGLAPAGAVPLISPLWVAELDLTTASRSGLHQKWRNRLRHGERRKLRITRSPLTPWLLEADARQQRQRGYRGWPEPLLRAYTKANPGKSVQFTAHSGNTPVAALLLLRHGTGATYQIGHSTDLGRQLSAHNLLMWNAITWLSGKGCQRLDLGTIDTETNPDLARFKLGTGALARPLGGSWLWWPPLGRVLAPVTRWDRALMRG